jgi:hypothetical protein
VEKRKPKEINIKKPGAMTNPESNPILGLKGEGPAAVAIAPVGGCFSVGKSAGTPEALSFIRAPFAFVRAGVPGFIAEERAK